MLPSDYKKDGGSYILPLVLYHALNLRSNLFAVGLDLQTSPKYPMRLCGYQKGGDLFPLCLWLRKLNPSHQNDRA